MGEMKNSKTHITLRNATLTRWDQDKCSDWGGMTGLKQN